MILRYTSSYVGTEVNQNQSGAEWERACGAIAAEVAARRPCTPPRGQNLVNGGCVCGAWTGVDSRPRGNGPEPNSPKSLFRPPHAPPTHLRGCPRCQGRGCMPVATRTPCPPLLYSYLGIPKVGMKCRNTPVSVTGQNTWLDPARTLFDARDRTPLEWRNALAPHNQPAYWRLARAAGVRHRGKLERTPEAGLLAAV